MTVWRSLDEVEPAPSAVTIGFFDGVHRGHQALVAAAAGDGGLRTVAVTFDRHPAEVVRPGTQPKLLMTRERRVRTLLAVGADAVLVLPFTADLAALAPEEFVDRVLVGTLDARRVVVGGNFRFGRGAAGDVGTLAALGDERGYATEVAPLVEVGGTVVSSTEVRERLAAGDVAWVARALGRPFVLDGVVVTGDRRGRELGVPTINVEAPAELALPAVGVYAGEVATPAGTWPGVTSVGVRPTFGGDRLTVESHLIGFDGDLYGAEVAVAFAHRLRDEERFDRVEDLVTAMRADIERGRALLTGSGGSSERS